MNPNISSIRRAAAGFSALIAAAVLGVILASPAHGQPADAIAGTWVINEELSDDTDDRVEAALRAAGEPIRRSMFNSDDEYYRGGPEEQELYDQMSYEDRLHIETQDDQYVFTYGGDYPRRVQLGNPGRSISLNNLDQVEDFSFAHWENNTLVVEARPRDGGFTDERYTLSEDGYTLTAELFINPQAFREPIELTRIYNRPGNDSGGN